MDDFHFGWAEQNVAHIDRHDLTPVEVEEAILDPNMRFSMCKARMKKSVTVSSERRTQA